MKQTIEIEVPDGMNAIWKDGKVIFEKKSQLPKTWKKFCQMNPIKNSEVYIDDSSIIRKTKKASDNRLYMTDKIYLSNINAARAHLALMQLHQLRDCYRQGWEPDWSNDPNKYCIVRSYNSITKRMELMIVDYDSTPTFLSFQTRRLPKEFLTNLRELMEEAGDLI